MKVCLPLRMNPWAPNPPTQSPSPIALRNWNERSSTSSFVSRFDHVTVNTLPDAQRHAMLTSASTYAATKLAEVEARAHYIHDIHGTAQQRRE